MTRCSPKCECRVRRFWIWNRVVGFKNELGDAAPTPEAASPRFAAAETATVWASVSEADAHPFLNSEQRAAKPLQHSAPSVSVHEHMSVCVPRGVVESRPKGLRPRNSGLSPFHTAPVCDQIAPMCKYRSMRRFRSSARKRAPFGAIVLDYRGYPLCRETQGANWKEPPTYCRFHCKIPRF